MKKLLILLVLILSTGVGYCKDYSRTPTVSDIPNYSYNLNTAINYSICKNNKGGDACINYLNVRKVQKVLVINPFSMNMFQIENCKKYAKCGGSQQCYEEYLK